MWPKGHFVLGRGELAKLSLSYRYFNLQRDIERWIRDSDPRRYVTRPSWWISQRYRVTKWCRGVAWSPLDDWSWWSVTNKRSQPGIGLVPSTYICSWTLSHHFNILDWLSVWSSFKTRNNCTRDCRGLLQSEWPNSLWWALLSYLLIRSEQVEP